MFVLVVVLVILASGALGGFINALLAGDLHLPHRRGKIYSPGWIGNVVIGAVAALVYWGLYGPLAKSLVLGATATASATLTVAEIAGSILTGVAGGRILTSEVEKKALVQARNMLADAMRSDHGAKQ